jgi:hypothetical protein
VGEFDDAEELVAEFGEGSAQEARGVLEGALFPDPTIGLEGETEEESCGTGGEEEGAQGGGSFHQPVESKNEEVAGAEGCQGAQGALEQFESPDAVQEGAEFGLQQGRQGEIHSRGNGETGLRRTFLKSAG